MRRTVKASAKQAEQKGDELQVQIDRLESTLQELSRSERSAMRDIDEAIGSILNELKERDRQLKQRLRTAVLSKRQRLQSQLDSLLALCADAKHSNEVAEQLLKSTVADPCDAFKEMYLVAAADAVEFHVDDLCEEADKDLFDLRPVDVSLSATFLPHSIREIRVGIRALGGIDFCGEDAPPPPVRGDEGDAREGPVVGGDEDTEAPATAGLDRSARRIAFSLSIRCLNVTPHFPSPSTVLTSSGRPIEQRASRQRFVSQREWQWQWRGL